MVPFITRQLTQFGMIVNPLRHNRNIRLTIADHLRNSSRAPLLDRQIDPRITLHKIRHNQRQRIACLRMRRRNRQSTAVVIGKLAADILNILDISQNPFRNFQHRLTRLGNRHHTLAAAYKNLHPQFFFQKADLLGNTRLRSK